METTTGVLDIRDVEEAAELSGRGEGGSESFSYWLMENSDVAPAEASGTKPSSAEGIGDASLLGG